MAEQTLPNAIVAVLAQQCIQRFEAVEKLISDVETHDLRSPLEGFTTTDFLDIFARFRIWTGNIGALQRGRASLDNRIEHTHVYDEVKRLLREVALALLDCKPIDSRTYLVSYSANS